MIDRIVHFSLPPQFTTEEQFIPTFRLIYIVEGQGHYLFDGERFEFNKGDIISTIPGKRIVHNNSNHDSLIYVISLAQDAEEFITESYCSHPLHKQHKLFEELFKEIVFGNRSFNSELISLFLKLFQEHQEQKTNAYDPRIQKALQFIEQNIQSKINIDELAQQCSLSSSHFRQLFKEEINESPKKYVLQKRMDYALQLLSTEGLSLKETAFLMGIGVTELSRQFKIVFNETPKAYINKHKKTPNLSIRSFLKI